MSYMVNKIIQCMVSENPKKFTEQRFIDRERDVEIEKVSIKVKLSSEAFYKIRTQIDDDMSLEQ